MGIFDFRDLNKRKQKETTIHIQCDNQNIYINNHVIGFPTTYAKLKNILGEATRIEQIKQSKNQVYLWDDIGIYCATADPERMLMLLLVSDNRYGLGHQPINNFTGTVLVDGEQLENSLENVGIDRPYILRSIIKENKQVAIAIGWNPQI